MKTAAYARYSSDLQSDASIEDQLRNIRRWCARAGFEAPAIFEDRAISGTRQDRPGYQSMMAAARRREFSALVVDDLSRLSRDQVECQRAIRELKFMGIRVVGASDGIDTDRKGHKIEVGLRGLMSDLYLDDLADKTHRGLTGRALAGASAGGLPFGYRVTEVGQRAIDPDQAEVVREIHTRFLSGENPRQIAHALNARGTLSAHGGTWTGSAIYGDAKRHIGILVNPLYVGRQIWNRSQWIKDPTSGRRIRRERPSSDWIASEHPELRIVDQALWDGVQARLADTRQRTRELDVVGSRQGPAPKYLLSGLLQCSVCGGPMVSVNLHCYGCSRHKDRGAAVCDNSLRVRRDLADRLLLDGVRQELLSEEAFAEFARAAQHELRTLNQANRSGDSRKALNVARQTRDNIMQAIKAGILTTTTKSEMEAAEAAVARAERAIEHSQGASTAQILPRARELWKQWVSQLERVTDVTAAREALRAIFGGPIRVVPESGHLVAELAIGQESKILLVAGVGFEPTTFGL